MVSRSRVVLGQLLRLVASVPFLLVGVLALAVLLSVLVVALFFAFAVVFVVFAPEFGVDLSSSSGTWVYGVALAAVVGTLLFEWRRIRRRADRETAETLFETRPADDSGVEATVVRTLDRLCQQADVPTPVVRIRETEQPVCLTVRYRPSRPPAAILDDDAPPAADDTALSSSYVVLVSTGLLETLSDRELTAVLAHEVAHRSNWDLRATDALLALLYSASTTDLDWGRRPLTSLLLLLPMLVARATVSAAAIIFLRGREFAADYGGAKLSGDPAALAAALETLSDLDRRPSQDLRAAQYLNVLPVPGGGVIRRHSHPSAVVRVKRLRAMVDG